jgi:hypothetical protein
LKFGFLSAHSSLPYFPVDASAFAVHTPRLEMKTKAVKTRSAAKAKTPANERFYSAQVVDGVERAASRAMLYAVGFKKEDFRKAQIGVAST